MVATIHGIEPNHKVVPKIQPVRALFSPPSCSKNGAMATAANSGRGTAAKLKLKAKPETRAHKALR